MLSKLAKLYSLYLRIVITVGWKFSLSYSCTPKAIFSRETYFLKSRTRVS